MLPSARSCSAKAYSAAVSASKKFAPFHCKLDDDSVRIATDICIKMCVQLTEGHFISTLLDPKLGDVKREETLRKHMHKLEVEGKRFSTNMKAIVHKTIMKQASGTILNV